MPLPGKPVAYNYGLLAVSYGLLLGIVVYCFRLLGFPGRASSGTVSKTWSKATRVYSY